MKPPPRKRSNPKRDPPAPDLVRSGKWQRLELTRLLAGLRKMSRSATVDQEVDYCALKEHIKTRPVTEIQSMVNSLKDKVITCASSTFKNRRREERRAKKPIELWTHMSSSVAGTQEETINTAFAQMLIVSSKEPRSLKNCDPPRVLVPTPDQSRPAGRTVPVRPMPRLAPGPGVHPHSSPDPPLKVIRAPAPTVGLAGRLCAPSEVAQVPSNEVPAPQTQPGSKPGTFSSQTAVSDPPQPGSQTLVTPLPPDPGPTSSSLNSAALYQTPLSSLALPSSPSAPSPASSSSASSLSPASHTQPSPLSLSSQAATLCARFGRTSKYATEDSPRMLGLKCVVDFEKIYRYLSSLLKPDEECCLTPMEGAIVLDLLMSLQEELPQLDGNKLRKHLTPVYQTLSSPSDSKPSRDLFKDLQDRLSPEAELQARSDPQQSPARSADTQSGGVTQQLHKASNTTSSQEADITGARPPLNPFMVPVELLKRRNTQPQHP